jgi:DNA invertase Pin-like site-specific DNA recombinase
VQANTGDVSRASRRVVDGVDLHPEGGLCPLREPEVLHRYSNIRYMITSLLRARKAAGKSRKPGQSHASPAPIRKRLPKTLHPEIIKAYQTGATTRQLAKDRSVSKGNIEHLLPQAGVMMRNQPLGPEQIGEAARLHAQGLSTYKIAQRFGVVQSTVWRALGASIAIDGQNLLAARIRLSVC